MIEDKEIELLKLKIQLVEKEIELLKLKQEKKQDLTSPPWRTQVIPCSDALGRVDYLAYRTVS